jgi:hypothetical protein
VGRGQHLKGLLEQTEQYLSVVAVAVLVRRQQQRRVPQEIIQT